MKWRPWQYGAVGALLAIAVLYGIELSSDGIEDVYGPVERPAAVREQVPYTERSYRYGEGRIMERNDTGRVDDRPAADRYDQETALGEEAGYGVMTPLREPAAREIAEADMPYRNAVPPEASVPSGRLADGTAGMLQSVASGGIKLVVDFFDALTK